MAIRLRCLGAAGEVTGSKHLLQTPGASILIDCGAFQGKRAKADAKNRALLGDVDPASIDALVLSHAHFDHCGLIPLLVKRGFSGSIYSTSATRDLARLIMSDSARIQARDAEYLRKRAAQRGEEFDFTPLYDDLDVVRAMERFVTFNYGRPLTIADGVKAEFFDAGHILGSALIRFEIQDGGRKRTIGFSGDLGRKDKPIIEDPDTLPEVEALVLESTYGNKLHEPKSDALERLAKAINRSASLGGKVIIPAFAVERTQELIFELHLLQDEGKVPNIPIWVDSPMATDATAIFALHPECYDAQTKEAFIRHAKNPFGFSALKFSRSVEDSKAINAMKGPMIVISADGMCEFGRIQHHLIHGLGDPSNTLLIVGYMAEGTLGRRLSEGAAEARIHGDIYPVRCSVESLGSFSAHADWKETIDWLMAEKRDRLEKLFLVHGESEALDSLKRKVEQALAASGSPAEVKIAAAQAV
ncbi:MAG TPA: MBL fold metallo-hydrolase, partial [Rectinemataceae bacterium]